MRLFRVPGEGGERLLVEQEGRWLDAGGTDPLALCARPEPDPGCGANALQDAECRLR